MQEGVVKEHTLEYVMVIVYTVDTAVYAVTAPTAIVTVIITNGTMAHNVRLASIGSSDVKVFVITQ